jgi:hypothetical protein
MLKQLPRFTSAFPFTVLQKGTPGSSWPDCQRQLDAWLAGFAAAYEAEQQLLGEEGTWPNIAAGTDLVL